MWNHFCGPQTSRALQVVFGGRRLIRFQRSGKSIENRRAGIGVRYDPFRDKHCLATQCKDFALGIKNYCPTTSSVYGSAAINSNVQIRVAQIESEVRAVTNASVHAENAKYIDEKRLNEKIGSGHPHCLRQPI